MKKRFLALLLVLTLLVGLMPAALAADTLSGSGTEDDPSSGLWSYADRTREIARPGYYSVPLMRYGVTAEMTATARVGLHRYTFPASDAAAVVFHLNGMVGIARDGDLLAVALARLINGVREDLEDRVLAAVETV